MDKVKYDFKTFAQDMVLMEDKIYATFGSHSFTHIYGIPRGGTIVAMQLAKQMGLHFLAQLEGFSGSIGNLLIVDDVVDSGRTMKPFIEAGFITAAIHVKGQTPRDCYPAFFIQTTNAWIEYWWEKSAGADEPDSIDSNIVRILQFIGEDPNRIGLIDTPRRVRESYAEMFRGYTKEAKPRIMTVPNGEDGILYDEMLTDEGYFASFCEHHMLPFFGEYYFGYIPDKIILGCSKIARTIDYHSARLQVAERLCHNVVTDLEEALQPKGLILVMRARHMCKEIRGVKKWNSPYEAKAVRGYFADRERKCKEEFFARIGSR